VSSLFSSSVVETPWLIAVIFLAEMTVVTISTLRTIFVTRGARVLAPVLGFFEVTLWLAAIGEVMKNLSDFRCSLAFAGGFTLGNFLGILIEQGLALGSVLVRSITNKDAGPLVRELRAASYGVTCLDARGATGPVQMVFTVVPRRELPGVIAILKRFDPGLFYSVDALQAAAAGVGPAPRRRLAPLVPAMSLLSFRSCEKVSGAA
jgi:uncharacterized protein YebE (UPF0316 family)